MKKVKILHCGDLHFDTPFKELNKNISRKSKNELLEVFKKIIDLVIEKKVEVLLIAGDVFDNLTVNRSTIFFIIEQLKRISNVYVFISPGNHDPYGEKSFYKLIDFPNNIYIFKGELEKKEIPKLNVVIWGAAFRKKYEKSTLIEKVKIDKEKINIMLLHGEISNENKENEYNPIYLNDIKESKMDYIALGHRHKFSGILRENSTSYAYCGCPQGRGFDEIGEKGVILGDVFNGGTHLEFIHTHKRKYIIKDVDISNCITYKEVMQSILSNCEADERKNNFYKIVLRGNIKENLNFDEKVITEMLEDEFYYIKIIDNSSIEINLDTISKNFSIRGKFISKIYKLLEEAKNGDEKEILNIALKLGIKSISQEEVKLDDY